MMNERTEALAKFLGIEVEEVKDGYTDKVFETEEGEYLVLTNEEADDEFYDYERDLIDELGLESFSDWARDYIINNFVDTDTLKDYIREYYESYVEDIKCEVGRLEEEMAEAEVDTEEDYIDYLCEEYEGNESDYFIYNFGMEYFTKLISDECLVNWDDVIEWLQREDGRGCLASYDGVENEEGDFYIYKLS